MKVEPLLIYVLLAVFGYTVGEAAWMHWRANRRRKNKACHERRQGL